jgi:hypothetical protein
MPLTKSEREEINRAIKDSIVALTARMEANRGSPEDQAFAAGVERGMQMLGTGAQRFVDYQRPRMTLEDRVVGGAIDEGLLLATQPKARKRRASQFNKAISAGMTAVRKSRFMGKAGKITNPKKAFATVTKTVSSAKKGRKPPKKGVRGAIYRAVRRFL